MDTNTVNGRLLETSANEFRARVGPPKMHSVSAKGVKESLPANDLDHHAAETLTGFGLPPQGGSDDTCGDGSEAEFNVWCNRRRASLCRVHLPEVVLHQCTSTSSTSSVGALTPG